MAGKRVTSYLVRAGERREDRSLRIAVLGEHVKRFNACDSGNEVQYKEMYLAIGIKKQYYNTDRRC